ncbi:MAG TPA: hypothetical protein VD833_09335 [Vicinamibacterales bacterium]|nr:hypothetical protein [Vicinamibacterales bacterium]
MRRRRLQEALAICAVAFCLCSPSAQERTIPKFYEDDPIARVPETQDASKVQARDISLALDALINLFGRPGQQRVGRAESVNTVDEVPDSSWFTSRPGLTPEEVERGVNDDRGPAPGQWSVSRKADGVSAGFTITDSRGRLYFVKFDPPGHPELGTGAEAVVTRLFHALGYFVPQANIAAIRREDLVVAKGATVRELGGGRRPMRPSDIDDVLARAERHPDGSYRAIVAEGLPGTPLGGFKYAGTRPDDPNDIIPHENRRELRGLRVFSAWVNHTDAKALNSLDTLMTGAGQARVRHHLIDFNATLGSAGIGLRERRDGYEYLAEVQPTLRAIPAFGFSIRPWMTIEYPDLRGIGRFEAERFVPEEWRPRVPNPAYIRARPDDLFWAARRLMLLSEAVIRAAVRAGRYSDPTSEQFLVEALLLRRGKIARAYLVPLNPVVDPVLSDDGRLSFGNAAVEHAGAAAPAGYRAVWHRFDNESGAVDLIGTTEGPASSLPASGGLPTAPGRYIRVDISTASGAHASWAIPVHAYFRRLSEGWKLVGFDRMPDAPAMKPGLVVAEP